MLFRVLGPLEVSGGEATVPRGAGPRALLTALLLQPNSVVPAYRLAEAIWGADPPDRMDNALHQVVTRVRRALGPAGAAVVTRPPGYLLVAGASSIDAACFETQYRAAMARSAADPGAAVVLLDEALAWWRGPAYAEFADGFARPAATRLEELRLAAREDRAGAAARRWLDRRGGRRRERPGRGEPAARTARRGAHAGAVRRGADRRGARGVPAAPGARRATSSGSTRHRRCATSRHASSATIPTCPHAARSVLRRRRRRPPRARVGPCRGGRRR